jgi:3-oxoacyl-[acyl-carrier-protein] synthase-3
MVDTNDEWIMQRIGIKERRILKEKGKATSYLGKKAVKDLLEKTGIDPLEIQLLICATITPDMHFPATSNLICEKAGLSNAFGFDLNAACSGFMFALETGRRFIESGAYTKVIVVARYDVVHHRLQRPHNLSPLQGWRRGSSVNPPQMVMALWMRYWP